MPWVPPGAGADLDGEAAGGHRDVDGQPRGHVLGHVGQAHGPQRRADLRLLLRQLRGARAVRRTRQAAGRPGRDSAAARSRARMLAGASAAPACTSVRGRNAWAKRGGGCGGQGIASLAAHQRMLGLEARGYGQTHSQGRTC